MSRKNWIVGPFVASVLWLLTCSPANDTLEEVIISYILWHPMYMYDSMLLVSRNVITLREGLIKLILEHVIHKALATIVLFFSFVFAYDHTLLYLNMCIIYTLIFCVKNMKYVFPHISTIVTHASVKQIELIDIRKLDPVWFRFSTWNLQLFCEKVYLLLIGFFFVEKWPYNILGDTSAVVIRFEVTCHSHHYRIITPLAIIIHLWHICCMKKSLLWFSWKIYLYEQCTIQYYI